MRTGFTEAALVSVTKLNASQFKAIRAGTVELTSLHKKAIEQLTGKTCGQLAAFDLEPQGGPLTELMAQWAAVVPVRHRTKSAKAKRAG